MLGAEGEDNFVTHSICVYARPFLDQIRNSLVAVQDDHISAQES